MQFFLIAGIVFATGGVMFALQNNQPVTVVFGFWRFDSTLAMVLLLSLGLGALGAALVAVPTTLRRKWTQSRQRRSLEKVEQENEQLRQKVIELEFDLDAMRAKLALPPPATGKPELILPVAGNDKAGQGGA